MPETRREFVWQVLASPLLAMPALAQDGATAPWYRRAVRWGQTNINEMDPRRYDIDWWRQHWQRTHVQGLVINAGGIVAYYPSKFPLQYRAQFLDERDLFGELVRAAHTDGIAVLARMDSNRAREDFYKEHPDWFAVDAQGNPYRAGDRYISCIDSPYYGEYLPEVLREIIAWEKPDGFTDNSWSGLGRSQVCHCKYSRDSFQKATGKDLPDRQDWNDATYREWIEWSYARRTEIWDLNNRTTKEAGGDDCIWVGMLGSGLASQGRSFRDIKAIAERTEMFMLDGQSRSNALGFQANSEAGKRLHGLLGWDKVMPESMATYQRSPTFRKAAASVPESQTWMYSGIAGGIQPWWHHVGAYQWDRRQFQTEIPVYDWHAANEQYLLNRRPVASVGIVYSFRNADYFGRDNAQELVARPYYGMIQAMVRARIPYLPIHAEHIDRDGPEMSLLILPNLGAMSDEEIAAVRRFAGRGGGLLITGESGLYDRWGDRRSEFAFTDLLGIRHVGQEHGSLGEAESWGGGDHSYLRLVPDLGREVYGPKSGEEPVISGQRHPVLRGFESTDLVAFGGQFLQVEAAEGTEIPLTLIPDFPAYPPETSWMRTPRTNLGGLVLRERPDGGRSAYLAADIDRRFARDNLPDHGDLLANIFRWTARERIPLEVNGPGLVDCHLYRQEGRLLLHLVNITSAGTWRTPVDELIPVGPLQVRLRLPDGIDAGAAELRVAGRSVALARRGGWAEFELARLVDHELAVIE
jgi:hypothetical protein